MTDGEGRPTDRQNSRTLAWLLGLYCVLGITMLQSPVDAEFSFLASIPPLAVVLGLVATHRYVPLSKGTYFLIVLFLSLHLVGTHYTYARTPLGDWLKQAFDLERNPFDRIVHFCFGALLLPPIAVSLPLVALACTGLIVAGYVLSLPGMDGFIAGVNRTMGVLFL